MRVTLEQLPKKLSKPLSSTCLIFGNETVLKQEALKIVLDCALKQGFEEKHRFTVDKQLNWQDIYEACQAQSLFSSRQVLILTLPESALSVAQGNALKALLPLLHEDILLLLDGPKLNKSQEASQWFSGFEKRGLYVQCNTPEASKFPQFIVSRCQILGLNPDPESLHLLATWYEGNLFALLQNLMLLQLLYPDGKLTLIRLQDALSRNNHFTPFQLIDALIEGKPKRAIRILHQLEGEAVEIVFLLRTVQKELIQLCKIQEALLSGMDIRSTFDQFRIWPIKRSPLTAALHRLPLRKLFALLGRLAELEIMVKSDVNGLPWTAFRAFCIDMCGISTSISTLR